MTHIHAPSPTEWIGLSDVARTMVAGIDAERAKEASKVVNAALRGYKNGEALIAIVDELLLRRTTPRIAQVIVALLEYIAERDGEAE